MDTKEPIPIAIIGMGCRYPGGAHSPSELWDLVASGRDTWTKVPPDRYNESAFYHPDPDIPQATNQKGGHFLMQPFTDFDPGFFGLSVPEAEAMDPLQRVFLETAWEAVENAGITMNQIKGSNTAVYLAMFGHDAEQLVYKDSLAFDRYQAYGVTRLFLANRLSYLLDLHGPSMMLDTACSGSLVAIHLACQALRLGETEAAIAGGVNLIFSPDQMAFMTPLGVFNDEGRSFSWDERGNGYGRGEGAGIVLLKRLDDAIANGDPIRAIIRNSAVSQDGKTNGISMPSQAAQEQLARDIFRGLPFSPKDIQYAEAHGTGTKAGDKIELQAMRAVLASGREIDKPLVVGAIKSNIGHSEAASGAAGLIRTVMSIEKGLIAPQALLKTYKPGLEPEAWNIMIPRELMAWPATTDGYRRAIVNSFGFGGTNAMLVLESAVQAQPEVLQNGYTITNGFPEHPDRLFFLSAKSDYSLSKVLHNLQQYIGKKKSIIDLDALSKTLASGRTHFPVRFATLARDTDSLIQALSATVGGRVQKAASSTQKNATAFIFTGQGAQWARMGHALIGVSHIFCKSILDSDDFLRTQLGAEWSLKEELSRPESDSRLNDSRFGQPASTAVQIALVDLLRSWGIVPAAVLGHSSGEIAAAYAAGVLSSHTAMTVSYHRSFLASLSKEKVLQRGAMLAVGLGEEDVRKYVSEVGQGRVVVACINSPSSTTLSGDEDAVQQVQSFLDQDSVFNRRLKVDTAYHSHHMSAVAQDYLDRLHGLEFSHAQNDIRFFSSVTETEKHDDFGAAYWVSNLESPVRFAGALQTMTRELRRSGWFANIVEVGPHKALAGPIRQTLQGHEHHTYVGTLERRQNCVSALLTTGARLYETGVSGLDPSIVATLGISTAFTQGSAVSTDLPSYAWDHRVRYWSESRLSREHRFRQHGYDPLIGSRVIATPGTHPSWRILISHDKLPWLKDHMVDEVPVFPGAGYMSMAIQALAQLHRDGTESSVITGGYHLRNIMLKRALAIPKDITSRDAVEVILSFRHMQADESFDFVVSSFQLASADAGTGKWVDHCTGNIRFEQDEEQTFSDQESQVARFESIKENCSTGIFFETQAIYHRLTAMGNHYGPSFALTRQGMRMTGSQGISIVEIPEAAEPSPFSPHLIHPAVLDGIIQTTLPLFTQHGQPGAVMLSYIADVWVSADIIKKPTESFDVICELSDTFKRSTGFEVAAFQKGGHDHSPHCVVTVSGEAVAVGDENAIGGLGLAALPSLAKSTQEREKEEERSFVWNSRWGLDITSVTASQLESTIVPLECDEIGMSLVEKFDLLDGVAARYISVAMQELARSNTGDVKAHVIPTDFRRHQYNSFLSLLSSPNFASLASSVPFDPAALSQLVSRLGTEGEGVSRLGSQLVDILTGKTDALGLLLQDNLLFRYYHGDGTARPSQYIADYISHLTFQRPGLRILEVGAGTGGTTARIFGKCQPSSGGGKGAGKMPFCAEYKFTDISAGFFEHVRSGMLKPWADMDVLSFQVLDLERDPLEQGFEEGAYDLVIAANVVHATKSIRASLQRVRKLLKPGGILGLVEITRCPVFVGMLFGCLEGWWAGVEEGRGCEGSSGPIQSTDQWDEHLRMSGFSGVDLVAADMPEPWGHMGLMLSTAFKEDDEGASEDWTVVDSETTMKTTAATTRIEILNALPPVHDQFVQRLADRLLADRDFTSQSTTRKGGVTTTRFSNSEDTCIVFEDDVTYVILDSAENHLITHATPTQLSSLTRLLSQASRMYWISFASHSRDNTMGFPVEPDNALIRGLTRVAMSENNKLLCFTLDVQDNIVSPKSMEAVMDSILEKFYRESERRIDSGMPLELELMLRDGDLHIQRFLPEVFLNNLVASEDDEKDQDTSEDKSEVKFFDDQSSNSANQKVRLEVQKPGFLGSLTFVVEDNEQTQLGPHEIEIEPQAWGLNYKDLLIATGQLHPRQTMSGELAGTVVRIGSEVESVHLGDRVAALSTYGDYFSSLSRTDHRLAHKIPESMSFSEAAAIPVAYGSALYSLIDCAGLKQGMTVLIHAATGAQGQAAVEMALKCGTTVFATADTPDKRQLVSDKFGIPEKHVFSSRTAAFASRIRDMTGGRGVDVVLNSLAGPLLAASWRCVADLGTFIELGKVDISKRGQIDMEPFDRGVRFVAVDMAILCKRRPDVVNKLLLRVFEQVTNGEIRHLMISGAYPIGEIEDAMRHMQEVTHVGKIVLQADRDTTVLAQDRRTKIASLPAELVADATYIIAGGLGAVGKTLCRHLQLRGARRVVLLTRREMSDEDRITHEQALVYEETPDARVKIIACDISDHLALHRTALTIHQDADLPPVKGVIQSALVLADRTLDQITRTDFDAVLTAKYQGTKNLWTTFGLVREHQKQPLDFFLLLSSVTGIIGSMGQANYAATATYQDMFSYAASLVSSAPSSPGNSSSLQITKNVVTLDVPLITDTQNLTQEHFDALRRQGVLAIDVDQVIRFIDYVISGRAVEDGCHQICFGMHPGLARPFPLSGHAAFHHQVQKQRVQSQLDDHGKATQGGAQAKTKQDVGRAIASATSTDEAEALILASLCDKVSSLTAVGGSNNLALDVDVPLAGLGLDSLIATEMKNWIYNTLAARVQISDIVDAASLRSLAGKIARSSQLLERVGDRKEGVAVNGINGVH